MQILKYGSIFWLILDMCGLFFIYCRLIVKSNFFQKNKSRMDSWTLATILWVLIGSTLVLLELFKILHATPLLLGLTTASVAAAFVSYYFSNFSLQIITFVTIVLIFCASTSAHYGFFL